MPVVVHPARAMTARDAAAALSDRRFMTLLLSKSKTEKIDAGSITTWQ
jgi:hypothetical protein